MIPFPVTRRSVVERVRSADDGVRRAAFGDLAEGYWRPSYHYVRLHWRLTPEAAEDAIQSFFATAFEKQYVEKYDPEKARFRTFLRVCLDRFVQNIQKADRTAKRGGAHGHISLDFPEAEREVDALASRDRRDLDRFFRDEMIRALFTRTIEAMRVSLEAEGKANVFRAFDLHDVRPDAQTTYASVAAALEVPVTQLTNYLHLARKRFRDLALDNLRAICGTDDEFRSEARELFGFEVSS